jgi:hypothetical protein
MAKPTVKKLKIKKVQKSLVSEKGPLQVMGDTASCTVCGTCNGTDA